MIKIHLKDGRVLVNDPRYGLNLDSVRGIRECLDEGRYCLTPSPGRVLWLENDDVLRVYEDN